VGLLDMTPAIFVLLLIVVGVVVMARRAPGSSGGRRRPRGLAGLRREYARLLQMPLKAAHATTDRVLSEMERDYPGRSTKWLLQKMIADLERDRR
jgi:hypothetical protein